jgi:hypothetical protein
MTSCPGEAADSEIFDPELVLVKTFLIPPFPFSFCSLVFAGVPVVPFEDVPPPPGVVGSLEPPPELQAATETRSAASTRDPANDFLGIAPW